MAADNATRFRDFVLVSLDGKVFVTERDERALAAEGIARFDLDMVLARGIVSAAAHQSDVILASEQARQMRDLLRGLGSRKGRVTRREFKRAVTMVRAASRNALDEKAARAWLKQVVERNDFTVARGGLTFSRRWFNRIPVPVTT